MFQILLFSRMWRLPVARMENCYLIEKRSKQVFEKYLNNTFTTPEIEN